MVEYILWGSLAAFGMFIGGLGGGAFLVAAITSLSTGNKHWDLLKFGAYLAGPAAIFDVALLAVELGHPERAMFIYSNQQSIITIGASLLSIFIIIALIYASFLPPDSFPWMKTWFPWCKYPSARHVFEVIGLPFAVGTSYTGVLLAGMASKPIWNTPILPMLFFFSAVLSGLMALGLALSALYRTKIVKEELDLLISTINKIAIAGIGLCIVTLALAAFYLMMMLKSPVTLASEAGQLLASGSLSPLFIGGFVIAGLLIPLILCALLVAMKKKGKTGYPFITVMVVSSILVLAGNPLMRYAVVAAGQLVGL